MVGSKSGNISVVSNVYMGFAGSESLGGGIFSIGCGPVVPIASARLRSVSYKTTLIRSVHMRTSENEEPGKFISVTFVNECEFAFIFL